MLIGALISKRDIDGQPQEWRNESFAQLGLESEDRKQVGWFFENAEVNAAL